MLNRHPRVEGVAAAAAPEPRTLRTRLVLAAVSFAVGLSICALIAAHLGTGAVREALLALSAWLPLLLCLEAGRFFAELMSTRQVLRAVSENRVGWPLLLQAQCVAHACNNVMPAGRAAGEGLKAALISPVVGMPTALGVGTASQIMTLLVNGTTGLAAAVAAYIALGAPREALLLWTYGMVGTGAGVAAFLSLRSGLPLALLRRVRWAARLERQLSELAQSGAGFGHWALLWHAVAKAAQALQLGVLLAAVGKTFSAVLAVVAQGVQLLGAAAGDLLPAQLGATEGAFALAAPALGVSASDGLSMALVMHGTQLLFSALTLVAAMILKAAQAMSARNPARCG